MSKNIYKKDIDFVIKVNEIYHDIEGKEYENKHPEIFNDESKRWNNFGKKYLRNNKSEKIILDVGSGTGFVPITLGKYLKKSDTYICSDVSKTMLNVCKKNLLKKNYNFNTKFVKLDGKEIKLKSNSVDIITINSVMHHIPNLSIFLKEIDRVLKKKGFLVIGHEPNKKFSKNFFYWYNYRLFFYIFSPKNFLYDFSKKIKVYNLIKKNLKKNLSNDLLEDINSQLHKQKLITKNLTYDQIIEMVDFHSPTAGTKDRNRGILIEDIKERYLKNFNIVKFESYNHLSKISKRNFFTNKYDSLLKKLNPKHGALFFVILNKK